MTEKPEPLFTEEQLDKLLATDSIAERNKLEVLLEVRVDYIVRECFFKTNKTDGWWSWEYYEGEYVDPTSFLKRLVRKETGMLDICIIPDCGNANGYIYDGEEWGFFDGGMPLDLLWTEDVKDVVKECYQEWKKAEQETKGKQKKRREEIKEYKKQYRASAIKKLTAEEKWACGLSKKFPKSLGKEE